MYICGECTQQTGANEFAIVMSNEGPIANRHGQEAHDSEVEWAYARDTMFLHNG